MQPAMTTVTRSEKLNVNLGFRNNWTNSDAPTITKTAAKTKPWDENLSEWFKMKIADAKEYAQQRSGPEKIIHFSNRE